jgi:uncharacterized protein YcbK (DUF882 family)
MGDLSPHFDRMELSCRGLHCCYGECKVVPQLVQALEQLRVLAGVPIIVHDAYRCPKHNAEVGGVAKSEHPLGMAADIEIVGKTLNEMYQLALKVPAFEEGGIGIYDGKPFIHVDVRGKKARWSRVNGKYLDISALLG